MNTKSNKKKFENEWNIDPQFVRFNKQYDSYYDKRDGRWLDKKCKDPACPYCFKRPLRAKILT